jgi:hypothetical protein
VVASKPSAFYLRYGLVASGNYKNNLSNGGEEILVSDPNGNTLINFMYSDDAPWPLEADGDGYSLVSLSYKPTGNPGSADYWRKSVQIAGSPFADDLFPMKDAPPLTEEMAIRIFPNPTSGMLQVVLPQHAGGTKAWFELYGINGNLVHEEDMYGSGTIQLESLNLSSGIYFVRIRTGHQIFTEKIIYY